MEVLFRFWIWRNWSEWIK